ncbi:non-heme ferritin, partial [Escherichia coli]|nr:non-heme ferritin [Escherichia coli]
LGPTTQGGGSHLRGCFGYRTGTGNFPRFNTVETPFAEYSSLDELFQETYKPEQLITQKINELAHAAMTNQDYPTFNFLQWYVSEQHEEEKLFKSIIDKLSLAGKSCEGLYFIDKELATLDTQN